MVGFLLRLLLSIIAAGALGVASAWWAMDWVSERNTVSNGPWTVDTSLGREPNWFYERAAQARFGLLYLDPSEALYFEAAMDASGSALTGNNCYRVQAGSMPAQWWALDVYNANDRLITNPQNRHSIVAKSDSDGIDVWLGTNSHDGDWIPIPRGEVFSMTLRLFMPDRDIARDPAAASLPQIEKVAC